MELEILEVAWKAIVLLTRCVSCMDRTKQIGDPSYKILQEVQERHPFLFMIKVLYVTFIMF